MILIKITKMVKVEIIPINTHAPHTHLLGRPFTKPNKSRLKWIFEQAGHLLLFVNMSLHLVWKMRLLRSQASGYSRDANRRSLHSAKVLSRAGLSGASALILEFAGCSRPKEGNEPVCELKGVKAAHTPMLTERVSESEAVKCDRLFTACFDTLAGFTPCQLGQAEGLCMTCTAVRR